MLGPTRIYLAVQPPPTTVQQPASSVLQPASTPTVTSPTAAAPVATTAQSPNKSHPKVVVQQVAQPDTPQVCYAELYVYDYFRIRLLFIPIQKCLGRFSEIFAVSLNSRDISLLTKGLVL